MLLHRVSISAVTVVALVGLATAQPKHTPPKTDKEKIAEGRHERFFVPDMQKFLARAMKKSAG